MMPDPPGRQCPNPSEISPGDCGLIVFRFFVWCALVVWLGGFTFYGAVVIPTAHRILGTHLDVGFITQEVTRWRDLSGR